MKITIKKTRSRNVFRTLLVTTPMGLSVAALVGSLQVSSEARGAEPELGAEEQAGVLAMGSLRGGIGASALEDNSFFWDGIGG